jgi:hypothetical protein
VASTFPQSEDKAIGKDQHFDLIYAQSDYLYTVIPDPPHDRNEADCFIYSVVDSQEYEVVNQVLGEQVDVPSFLLLDNIADVVDFPIYDEYDDDYDHDLP